MATQTFNPVNHTSLRNYESTFSAARGGASADELSSIGNTSLSVRTELNSGSTEYDIDRNFMIFETASIRGTVTAATLRIDVDNKASVASGAQLCLVSATPDSNSTIITADFNDVGATELSDSRVSATTTGYKTFTLNATGLAAISTTENTVLALRHNKDLDNSAPIDSESGAPRISTVTNGESLQPLLTVTYTPALNQAFII